MDGVGFQQVNGLCTRLCTLYLPEVLTFCNDENSFSKIPKGKKISSWTAGLICYSMFIVHCQWENPGIAGAGPP